MVLPQGIYHYMRRRRKVFLARSPRTPFKYGAEGAFGSGAEKSARAAHRKAQGRPRDNLLGVRRADGARRYTDVHDRMRRARKHARLFYRAYSDRRFRYYGRGRDAPYPLCARRRRICRHRRNNTAGSYIIYQFFRPPLESLSVCPTPKVEFGCLRSKLKISRIFLFRIDACLRAVSVAFISITLYSPK